MKRIFIVPLLLFTVFTSGQAWPSENWTTAVNLTSVMDTDGVNDLSGLHFNPVNNRLYVAQGDGRVRVLQWNTVTNTFSQLANKNISGGPEGITQANLNANEFYTIDENNYEIRRYTHTSNFSTVTLLRRWDLLASPSPMDDTGNTGPEGIVFVPDSYLISIGFISQQTGQQYTSVKGLGGLFFVAHQDEGYVWVFDLNPNTNDDFAYVGKYRTDLSESCDLSFDRSTGLMYILHNIPGNNTIEVTDLSTIALNGNERKFVITNKYAVAATPDTNENIEGFALTSKCPETGTVSAWLCRDVESDEGNGIQQDVLRWFNPFVADGTCAPLSANEFETATIHLYPNPVQHQLTVSGIDPGTSIQIYNSMGQLVLQKVNQNGTAIINVLAFGNGIYLLEANRNGKRTVVKFKKD